jgi:hypothetical protein
MEQQELMEEKVYAKKKWSYWSSLQYQQIQELADQKVRIYMALLA